METMTISFNKIKIMIEPMQRLKGRKRPFLFVKHKFYS